MFFFWKCDFGPETKPLTFHDCAHATQDWDGLPDTEDLFCDIQDSACDVQTILRAVDGGIRCLELLLQLCLVVFSH